MANEDLVQAVREGLASFLKAQLLAAYPDIAVYQDWPTKNQKAGHTIAVLLAGEPDNHYHPPTVIVVAPDAGPAITGTITYSIGRCEDLPLQLDCWANNEFERDKLARDLRAVLNQPASVTLGTGNGRDVLPSQAALVLALAGLFGQPAEYEFTPVQSLPENSDAAEKNEWRASWRGTARFSLIAQKASVPLRKRIVLLIGASELVIHTTPRETRSSLTTALRIVPRAIALARPGAVRLTAIATFSGGMTADVTKFCTFSTSQATIANVDASGLVTAGYLAGNATITVTYGSATATVAAVVS